MHTRVRAFLALSALLPTGQTLSAQTADLRYSAPIPASITYVTVDTMSMTMSGTPMGGMTMNSFVRSVNEVSFVPVDGGFDVTAVLVELDGRTTSPVGDIPITADSVPAMTIRLTDKGPEHEDAVTTPTPTFDVSSPGNIMGWAKAASGLVRLPGRELVAGETWSDTVRMRISPDGEGLQAETMMVTHGTYAGDTVESGRTLNILHVRAEMTMEMNGTVRGRDVTQTMTSTSDERILWDSVRHYSLSRDMTGRSRTEMSTGDQGMTIVMNGRARSITVAQPES